MKLFALELNELCKFIFQKICIQIFPFSSFLGFYSNYSPFSQRIMLYSNQYEHDLVLQLQFFLCRTFRRGLTRVWPDVIQIKLKFICGSNKNFFAKLLYNKDYSTFKILCRDYTLTVFADRPNGVILWQCIKRYNEMAHITWLKQVALKE